MNFPTTRYSTPAADPRTGRDRVRSAPRPRSQDPAPPVRRPAARAAQGPPAQGEPDRDRARRSLTRIRPGQGLLLAVQPPTGRDLGCCQQTVRNALAALQAAGCFQGRDGANLHRPGYLADLASGAGNPPPLPQTGWTYPSKRLGSPPQTGWTRIQNRGRRRERRIPKIRVRTITTGDPSDPDTGPLSPPPPRPYSGHPRLCSITGPTVCASVPPFPNLGLPSLWPPLPLVMIPLSPTIGCRPGPSCSTSAIPVSNTAKGSGLGPRPSGLPRDPDALGLVPPRPAPWADLAPGRPRSP